MYCVALLKLSLGIGFLGVGGFIGGCFGGVVGDALVVINLQGLLSNAALADGLHALCELDAVLLSLHW